MNHKVSIVIIGRNEERGIGECLSAAQLAAEQIGGAEIIYVDSASTDKTVAVAASFGVHVLSLKPDWKLSPSAGRFVGSHYARGDFILFIDADTLVYRDFLPAALEHFQNNADVGGINGRLDDLNENGELLTDVEERFDDVTDAKWLRGPCCFYRRRALEQAGSFNPYLAIEEEAELGLRLVKNGWKLQIIPVAMACHTRCYHLQTFKSIISAFRRDIVSKRLGEMTNTIARAFYEGFGMAFCWLRLKTTIVFLGWLILLSTSLFLPQSLFPKTVSAAIFILGLLAVFRKKRSWRQTFLFIPAKILCLVDVLAGFHKINLKSPRSYPLDVTEHAPKVHHESDKRFPLRNIGDAKAGGEQAELRLAANPEL
ncbi:MAG TPA: glycosyltransferase [Pyrinomonadaceae bacterium]|jgi:glycosyltransferase involved in cell wall biosynthesis